MAQARIRASQSTEKLFRPLRMFTFSAFLGFGLAACAGDQETAKEPVQAEESSSGASDPLYGDDQGIFEHDVESQDTAAVDTTQDTGGGTTPTGYGADDEGIGDPFAASPSEETAVPVQDDGEPADPPDFFAETSFDKKATAEPAPVETGDEGLAEAATWAEEHAYGPDQLDDHVATQAPEDAGMPVADGMVGQTTPEEVASEPAQDAMTTGGSETYASGTSASTATESQTAGSQSITDDGETYVVQPGDTLNIISSKIFGTAERWQELARINGINNPRKIMPGDELTFPVDASTEEFLSRYDSLPHETVTVQEGDTLARLANRIYGNAWSWRMLYKFNSDKLTNPDHIMPGMVLEYVAPSHLPEYKSHTAEESSPEEDGATTGQVQGDQPAFAEKANR